jgi:CDP-glycerol glycerophosphotransferase (TagB/SpsB family)
MFDIFFLTSTTEVENVRNLGVKTKLFPAYPKIDSVFDGSITKKELDDLAAKIGLDRNKKTLLFASTWDKSGMSAIDIWYDKLSLLAEKYNILVTVHEWMSDKYKNVLKSNPAIYYIEDLDRIKYIMLADVCINDTSSLIAEFCVLDKPIITFKTENTSRTLPEIIDMITKISIRIDRFDELESAIYTLINNPDMFREDRQKISKIFFDAPDGYSGKRAAEKIIDLVPELKT